MGRSWLPHLGVSALVGTGYSSSSLINPATGGIFCGYYLA